MVNKILSFLGRDIESINQAAYILALSTVFTQLLGLIRDRLLAGTFGAGELLDVYYAAFKVQDIIFYCIASLLSLAVLIPLLSESFEKEGINKAKKLLDSLFTVSFVLIGIASIIGFILAPKISELLFPGLAFGSHFEELVMMTRLLLISPFLFSFSGLLASIVQLHNRFYLTALSPLLYNFGIIIGIVLLYPSFGFIGLGFGVLLGAFLHAFIQVPFVIQKGLLPQFTLSILWDDIRKSMGLYFYRGLGIGIQQIMFIFLLGLSTTIAAGSVSVMTLAQNLQGIPLSLIGGSYAIATFPVLSRFFSNGDREAFIVQLQNATRHIIFWSLPFAVLLIVLRAQIVRVILGSGSFSWSDTRLTAACLALFAVSVVFQGLSLLFIRAFYASQKNKEVLIVGFTSALTTILLSYGGILIFEKFELVQIFFEHLLRIEDINGSAIVMLPLAFSFGSMLNAIFFGIILKKTFSFKLGIVETSSHSFAASVSIGFVSYEFLDYFGTVFNLNTTIGIFLQGFFSGILGILFGIFLLFVLKNKEAIEVARAIKRRIKGEDIVGPQEI
ncbi:MAG: lipid II flippase MurJ [Patescibacteria group bacterium]